MTDEWIITPLQSVTEKIDKMAPDQRMKVHKAIAELRHMFRWPNRQTTPHDGSREMMPGLRLSWEAMPKLEQVVITGIEVEKTTLMLETS